MTRQLSFAARWRREIAQSGLPATARSVAAALDLHFDKDGDSCWPSLELLASETGLARSTVHSALTVLERFRWIEVEHSKGRRSNRYHARVGKPYQPSGSRTVQQPSGSRTVNRPIRGSNHPIAGRNRPGAGPEVVSKSPYEVAKEGEGALDPIEFLGATLFVESVREALAIVSEPSTTFDEAMAAVSLILPMDDAALIEIAKAGIVAGVLTAADEALMERLPVVRDYVARVEEWVEEDRSTIADEMLDESESVEVGN
jgi:hypothetical protein